MTNISGTNSLLRASEAAQLLNVHVNTIRRWSNSGILKSHRIGPRGDRRFSKEDIIEFLNEKQYTSDEDKEKLLRQINP